MGLRGAVEKRLQATACKRLRRWANWIVREDQTPRLFRVRRSDAPLAPCQDQMPRLFRVRGSDAPLVPRDACEEIRMGHAGGGGGGAWRTFTGLNCQMREKPGALPPRPTANTGPVVHSVG